MDVESRVETLEITGAITGDAMAQREILRARRRPDRVGLDEAERVERALQRRRREEAARDRKAPQVVERHANRGLLGQGHRLPPGSASVLASSVPVTCTCFAANFSGVF